VNLSPIKFIRKETIYGLFVIQQAHEIAINKYISLNRMDEEKGNHRATLLNHGYAIRFDELAFLTDDLSQPLNRGGLKQNGRRQPETQPPFNFHLKAAIDYTYFVDISLEL